MDMISKEEFNALEFDEQKDYLIKVIKNLSEDKQIELFFRMVQEGLIEKDGNVSE